MRRLPAQARAAGGRGQRCWWTAGLACVTRRGRGFVLQAERLTHVSQPKDPYLYFSSGT